MPIITLRSDAFFVPAFLSGAEGPSIEILAEGVLIGRPGSMRFSDLKSGATR